jgi:bifunctional ADP-heptose synthase (sugar kinase/adenylyltransferase)
MSAAGRPRKLIWVRKDASSVSGAGETVTAPLASAAEALSVAGAQAGAMLVVARLGEATQPNAKTARRVIAAVA